MMLSLRNRQARLYLARQLSTHDIRKKFVSYYEDYDHIHIPSSSVVPESSDKSLLFTNAGMNQFKSMFLGSTDNRWSCVERAVNYQRCVRAGGKHNDLEDVGKDGHHQTLFEMLGSWSFNGSYGKEAACELAWNFLVDVMKIDPSRLYVSYFGGSREISPDTACRDIWLKLGVPASHILPFVAENFWEMGAVGPCGPCTEIHYDRVGGRGSVSNLVNKDDSVVELWNIVFMSYNRGADGGLTHLPSTHIDTGMGLERLVSVVQNVPSNFDIDIFTVLLAEINKLSKSSSSGSTVEFARRLVADHIRTVTVAIADEVSPSATGAGFIARKMLRRALWKASDTLGMDRGSLSSLVPIVVKTLGSAYPTLKTDVASTTLKIDSEEHQFWSVVDKGRKVFDDVMMQIPKDAPFPGETAWKLHDTHGFTVDVTEELLWSTGRTIDMDVFNKLKAEAKMLSTRNSGVAVSLPISLSDFPTHSDKMKYEYEWDRISHKYPKVESKVLGLFEGRTRVTSLEGNGSVILEDCQFYAEDGGQKSDYGKLTVDGKTVFTVDSVSKYNGVTTLNGTVSEGTRIEESHVVTQFIDTTRREGLQRAHTATHLLNWALTKVGVGAGQRGSSVDVNSLRFDYATQGASNNIADVNEEIEQAIGEVILQDENVSVQSMELEKAREHPLLQSEFREGKSYPDVVRVVSVGDGTSVRAVECCSGTHVLKTSSISDFVVMTHRSSAKGVKKIQAVVGPEAKLVRDYGRRIIEEAECVAPNDVNAFKKTIVWQNVSASDTKRLNALLKERSNEKKLVVNA